MNKEDKFIDGVWDRVRYMEYMEIENKRVRDNERRFRRENLKTASILGGLLMAVVIIIFLTGEMNQGLMIAMFTPILGIGVTLQNRLDGVVDRKGRC